MAKTTKAKTFTVSTRLILIQDHEVSANSIEEAAEIGRTWGISDVVEATNIGDYSIKVTGVNGPGAWDTEQ